MDKTIGADYLNKLLAAANVVNISTMSEDQISFPLQMVNNFKWYKGHVSKSPTGSIYLN